MNNLFADVLRKMRMKKGLNQLQLANLMFVNKATVSKWESGKRLPDAAMITRLARVLEVDVGALLDDGGHARPALGHLRRDRDDVFDPVGVLAEAHRGDVVIVVGMVVDQGHRAFLVNLGQVERIVSHSGSMQLLIKHCHESIPVSRSHMAGVKASIKGE